MNSSRRLRYNLPARQLTRTAARQRDGSPPHAGWPARHLIAHRLSKGFTHAMVMTLKEKFDAFNQVAPVKTARVLGRPFPYRYYRNPDPKKSVTLVTLAGGSGLADGFFYLYDRFMPEYSLLSFAYPLDFPDNASTADAIAELLRTVGARNVYLMGQSYGGLIAQIVAKRHPEVVKGLILSGTCGLSRDVDTEGRACVEKMLDPRKVTRNIRIDRMLPTALLAPVFKLMAGGVIKDKAMRRDFQDIVGICKGRCRASTSRTWTCCWRRAQLRGNRDARGLRAVRGRSAAVLLEGGHDLLRQPEAGPRRPHDRPRRCAEPEGRAPRDDGEPRRVRRHGGAVRPRAQRELPVATSPQVALLPGDVPHPAKISCAVSTNNLPARET